MAFKMRPKSPLTKKLVGKQHRLPDHLKQKILDAPETPMKKIPEGGTGKDDKTGTYYYHGMAQSDRPYASSEIKHSDIEVEAARELNSGRVNRAQKRAKRKSDKHGKVILGGKARKSRVIKRRHNKARKASERADKITRKRFDKMSDLGKKNYNRVIERDNKERKEREAARDAQKNK